MVRESRGERAQERQSLSDTLQELNIILDQLSELGARSQKQDFTSYVLALNRIQELLTQNLAPLRLG